jgi:NADPH:quinone reductase-like Zn-dependent oxidoreductase/acyl carrier protein
MYPGDPGPLGGECAGTVVAVGSGVEHVHPGDDVIALSGGSFHRYVTTRADFVVPRPGRLSLAQAATNAIAYVTASVALNHLGQMQAGERVLIHAAAGGVGLAAVHLARASGAEVFATAGSPAKRAYLHELGVRHVFDSRSLDFADDILATTNGEGVDLVLNSLAGAFIPASLGLLRQGGRFLELGKRDHVSPDEIAALDKGIAYHVIDWGETAQEDPELISSILHDVLGRVTDGTVPALPVRSFPLQDAEDAFRYMARARHIGKVAVTWPLVADGVIRSDGFYLITGGLRGLGLEVARHLVGRGARHLLLLGRGAPTPAAQAVIDDLTNQGALILVYRGDTAQELDIVSALAAIDREGLPLRGVFHCAGVLDDGALTQQTWERFRHVLAPKIDGAWLLHQLTLDRPIEHFVLFSSVAAVLGSPGQANHAAANAYLDALSYHRRGMGLPALSINWGAWSDIGAAAAQAVSERARQSGLDAITPERGLQALDWLLGRGPAQAAVALVRWPVFVERFSTVPPFFHDVVAATSGPTRPAERASTSMPDIQAMLASATPGKRIDIVLDVVQDATGAVLGLAPSQIGTRTPLHDFGLDSLMAVELRNRLGQRFGFAHPLPATLVFDYPNVEAIASYLIESVLDLHNDDTVEEQPAPAPVLASGDLVAAMLDNLDALSDEDVDNILAERASQRGNR